MLVWDLTRRDKLKLGGQKVVSVDPLMSVRPATNTINAIKLHNGLGRLDGGLVWCGVVWCGVVWCGGTLCRGAHIISVCYGCGLYKVMASTVL